MNNYDLVAPIYDRLSRLLFGNALMDAQVALLPHLKTPCSLLIIGGGSGKILEHLNAMHAGGVHVIFIELSDKMLNLARQRNFRDISVEFVHAPIEAWAPGRTFDAVMTPFLFDNFTPLQAQRIFSHTDTLLEPGGQWLYTDFHISPGPAKIWQIPLLKSMYLFFRIFSKVEASWLPGMQTHFSNARYHSKFSAAHFGGFIETRIFVKP